MQTAFTEDQQQFHEVVSRFLQDKAGPPALRRLIETHEGYDQEVWQQMSGEIGLLGTHLPEAYGGFGFGPVELGIIAEEMGRNLYCGPFFATAVMAAGAILIGGNDRARSDLLPDLASGARIATLALDSLNAPDKVGHSLTCSNGKLSGQAPLVVDAHVADLFVVIAQDGGSPGLYCTDANAGGVNVMPVESLDPTRRLGAVTFSSTPAEKIGDIDRAILNAIWDYICVALAHEMIGGAQILLESTVDYTKMRYQFGRPIGSFQGLKHRCADLLMEVELAKAATHHAAQCLAASEGEPFAPSMAKALAADTYMKAAREAIQLRGGIGFTWEEDTHFWYKRAKSSEVFMGTPSMHRERIMTIIEAEGA